jgi:hypothetical protein
MTHFTLTINEFVREQIATWGQDYVDDLLDRGYIPVCTSAGWRWLYADVESPLTQAALAQWGNNNESA